MTDKTEILYGNFDPTQNYVDKIVIRFDTIPPHVCKTYNKDQEIPILLLEKYFLIVTKTEADKLFTFRHSKNIEEVIEDSE
jgi:hypothetical protein